MNFGTGAFTIEGWFNTTDTSQVTLMEKKTNGATYDYIIYLNNPSQGKIQVYFNGIEDTGLVSSGTFSTSTWNHFALVRSGTTLTLYLNGVSQGSSTSSSAATFRNTNNIWIGVDDNNPKRFYYTGYVDDIRITKGYARYSGNFTPPTSALKNK
jgi:hypothetical protein